MSFDILIIGFALFLSAVLIFVASLTPEEQDATKKVPAIRDNH